MDRRDFIRASAAAAAATPVSIARSETDPEPPSAAANALIWETVTPAAAEGPSLNGFTDSVPDIVGRIGAPIDLAIFTEGNHFPVLLGGEILPPFRAWAKAHARFGATRLDNIVIVTLPQPMIVAMIEGGSIALGNLTLVVRRDSAFYPDWVMGGASMLKALRKAAVIDGQARVFAQNRGLALLVAAGNPLAIARLDDVVRAKARVVLAGESEPGARGQYIAALEALAGRQTAAAILAREVTTFSGRLGIQHRDVLQAIATRQADVGIIFRHLAHHFATAYPQLCAMVTVSGAERFSSTLAMAATSAALRTDAAGAFAEFFLGVAREVYPRYEFARMGDSEFGVPLNLD